MASKGRSGSGGRRGSSGGGARGRGRSSSEARATTNREEIREWVQSRGGKPACVRGTGGGTDAGMLRIDFPGYSGQESLQEISWNEWFRAFDENDLAFLHQDRTADGAESRFNKLVSRSEAGSNGRNGGGRSGSGGNGRSRGGTSGERRAGGGGATARHSSGGRSGSSASSSRRSSTGGNGGGARRANSSGGKSTSRRGK